MPSVCSKFYLKSLFDNSLVRQLNGSFVVAGLVCATYYSSMRLFRRENYDKVFDEMSMRKKEIHRIKFSFFSQLIYIVRLIMPSLLSKELIYLICIALGLIGRTYADIWMIKNGTLIQSAIVSRNAKAFFSQLISFSLTTPFISIVNCFLRYSISQLKLTFRSTLTKYMYDKFLNGFTYYRMINVDRRITNPDQIITEDVDKLTNGLVDMYSNLLKPLIDIILYTVILTKNMNLMTPITLLVYLVLSGTFLTKMRRPLIAMIVRKQNLLGKIRAATSRIINSSEEIAFYRGNIREKYNMFQFINQLHGHLEDMNNYNFSTGLLDNVVGKYSATAIGYIILSRKFLDLRSKEFLDSSYDDRLQYYYQNGRLLLKLASSVTRVIVAGKDATKLSGYFKRIIDFDLTLNDLVADNYVTTIPKPEADDPHNRIAINSPTNGTEMENSDDWLNVLKPGLGTVIIKDDLIRFDDVPIVTPNGSVLTERLNFSVPSGVNVLVCGPNGCGKSSLFRVLGELWPLFGGTLTKPDKRNLFYIPQKPYMSLGTLRDQIIYPDTTINMAQKGYTDSHLRELMDLVQISEKSLEKQHNNALGLDQRLDWMETLSGGEKQRLAMARLLYHEPQFAILDECTSAVSKEVEGTLYESCKQRRITLLTVSHRESLWKHHDFVLKINGDGCFSFNKIDNETERFGN
ncbi:hypothetical protein SNEBB_004604 [Seison nebaliae]|nr:hypothetical protein SNEBB_004604 [Seison nebaliae]